MTCRTYTKNCVTEVWIIKLPIRAWKNKILSGNDLWTQQKLPDYLKLALQFEKIKKRFLTYNKFGDNLANSSLPKESNSPRIFLLSGKQLVSGNISAVCHFIPVNCLVPRPWYFAAVNRQRNIYWETAVQETVFNHRLPNRNVRLSTENYRWNKSLNRN